MIDNVVIFHSFQVLEFVFCSLQFLLCSAAGFMKDFSHTPLVLIMRDLGSLFKRSGVGFISFFLLFQQCAFM